MIKIGPAIVVEGRYDKNKVAQIFDTEIIEVSGFGLFKNKEMLTLLRRTAKARGLVILTDSDGAGLVIRNRIKSCISDGKIFNAYLPDIYGKESRKRRPSKEGKLGVEGVPDEVIISAVRNSGAADETVPSFDRLTKRDMFELGLSGRADSRAKRKELETKMSLPENLSSNALLSALNAMRTDKGYLKKLLFSETE